MKLKILGLLGLGLLGSLAARADTIQLTLGLGNAAISGFPAPYQSLTINLTDSTHATLTFNALSNSGFTYLMGDGGSVAVNVNGPVAVSNISETWLPGFTNFQLPAAPAGPGQEDGWGNFNLTFNSFDGYANAGSQISFQLTLTSGTWASAANVLSANNLGHFAAAHTFVCTGTFNCDPSVAALATGFSTDNGRPRDVPEPGTLALLGLGLVGLGLSRRHLVA